MKTFNNKVVEIACSIPKGRVSTYGHVARAAGGGSMTSRSVTGILSRAYRVGKTDIPWHLIVYADGKVWTNAKHQKERLELYKKEGIELDEKNKIKRFQDVLFEFK